VSVVPIIAMSVSMSINRPNSNLECSGPIEVRTTDNWLEYNQLGKCITNSNKWQFLNTVKRTPHTFRLRFNIIFCWHCAHKEIYTYLLTYLLILIILNCNLQAKMYVYYWTFSARRTLYCDLSRYVFRGNFPPRNFNFQITFWLKLFFPPWNLYS